MKLETSTRLARQWFCRDDGVGSCCPRNSSRNRHLAVVALVLPCWIAAAFLATLSSTWQSTQLIMGSLSVVQDDAVVLEHVLDSRPALNASVLHQASLLNFSGNEFLLDDFVVAGVNLAPFGRRRNDQQRDASSTFSSTPPFELFADFDLSTKLIGNETWVDLVRLRRDAQHAALPFYVDKVARKRWLQVHSNLSSPQTYVLNYKSELTESGRFEDEQAAIVQLLQGVHNLTTDYVAKPTHLSCSGGVWLISQHRDNNQTLVGHGKKPLQVMEDFSVDTLASSLAQDLHKQQVICGKRTQESWALQNVKPGFLVEERFSTPSWAGSSHDKDQHHRGGQEFKVFTIWGRVWLAVWRPGVDGIKAFLHRNGTTLPWKEGKSEPLPTWVDWPLIVAMAETLGAHKDMFRTDIFVGVPADGPALPVEDTDESEEQRRAIQYVVSETEIHPTPLRGTEAIFAEAGRLWLAGYVMGNYRVVPDTEVPREFVASGGFLSASK